MAVLYYRYCYELHGNRLYLFLTYSSGRALAEKICFLKRRAHLRWRELQVATDRSAFRTKVRAVWKDALSQTPFSDKMPKLDFKLLPMLLNIYGSCSAIAQAELER